MSKQIILHEVSVDELVLLLTKQITERLEVKKEPVERQEQEELLTRKQTAHILGVCLPTIHNWIKLKILKPYKMGNRTYFKRSEVMAYISSTNQSDVA